MGEHGVSVESAEFLVRHALGPFPEYRGDGKWVVVGQDRYGHYLQVIFIFDPKDVVYVIHARPLKESEKKRYRKRRR